MTEIPVPTANSGPTGITTGPDGELWFTEFAANKIGHTTVGGIAEFPASFSGAYPSDITSGPDGALWYTELTGAYGNGSIRRITTLGVGTIFYSPDCTHFPTALT